MSLAHKDPEVMTGDRDMRAIDQRIISPIQLPARRGWWIGFAVGFTLLMVLLASVTYLFSRGIGIWGVNIPVGWGFAIITFVWWIGIGHAGTFISAILLLLNQQWRTSINRLTEAMTLFAVACAATYPLLHLGRPERFYWLAPYPNPMGLWPQFRSPLIWDFFAIATYGSVSLMFWYLGLVPDLATMRDRSRSRLKRYVYGFFALGWRGESRHWSHHQAAYIVLAALATPLVLSVHSIVGMDFAVSIVPGWHSTIFPPYFVAGAIFSGFAMVVTIVTPLRAYFGFDHYITELHLENMAKVMLATGMMVTYGYVSEFFFAWYSDSEFERYMAANRLAGPYRPLVWTMLVCNCLVIQALWVKRVRRSPMLLFVISILVNVGMWLERYVIIITSLHRDYLVSSWGMFKGTFWDWSTLLGTIGLFLSLLYLFMRFVPMLSMYELKELAHQLEEKEDGK